jgi:hypothetical protein
MANKYTTQSEGKMSSTKLQKLIVYIDGVRLKDTYPAEITADISTEYYEDFAHAANRSFRYMGHRNYIVTIQAGNVKLTFNTPEIVISEHGAEIHVNVKGFFEEYFGIITQTKLGKAHLAYLRTLENYRPFWDLNILPDDELFQTDNAKLYMAGYMAARAEIVEEQRNAK